MMLTLLFLLFLIKYSYSTSRITTEIVNTTYGRIRGNHLNVINATVREFLGIPYALPPVNESRFGVPRPWTRPLNESIFNATKFGNPCMQGYDSRGFESKYFNDTFGNQSEDCLYLNIWVPRTGSKNTSDEEDPNDGEKNKGVLVFIHGGGLRYGSSSLSMYNGSYLAAKTKLIVVTMNYRLGVFGFAYMSLGENVTGNMGLLDQQLALKWVHENIANFTGDPNNVTLWGQGAGAACAAAHLFSKNSENYFQKLILMSGSITNLLYSVEESTIDNSVRTLAKQLKCKNKNNTSTEHLSHQDVFNCLINKTAEEIVEQSENETVTYYTNIPSVRGFNIILNDSVFFNGSVFEKLKTGNMKYYVNVLFGMPNNDGSFFLPILKDATQFGCKYDDRFNYTSNTCEFNETTYFNFFKLTSSALHFNASVFNDTIKKQYYVSNDNSTMRQNATKFLTDVLFRCRLIEFARKINIKTHGTYYAYYFNMTSPEHIWPDWMKSTHGDELYYAFGWPIKDFIEKKNKINDNETTTRNLSCITDSTNRTTEQNEYCKYKMERKTSYKMMDIIRNFTNIQGFYRNWEKFTDTYRRGVLLNPDFDPENITTIVKDVETDECRALLPYLPKYFSYISGSANYTPHTEEA